jgi:hypothetical protein
MENEETKTEAISCIDFLINDIGFYAIQMTLTEFSYQLLLSYSSFHNNLTEFFFVVLKLNLNFLLNFVEGNQFQDFI